MPEDTQPRIAHRKLWERVLYMVFCAIAYSIAEFVVTLVAIFQVLCVAFTGGVNERLHRLGRNVSAYIYELLQFVTFNDERVPFPFSDWPDEAPGASPWRREEAPRPAAERPAPASAPPREPMPPEAAPEAPTPPEAGSDEAPRPGPEDSPGDDGPSR